MKKNIHQILNEMEQYFPYQRKKVTVGIINDDHVYIEAHYALEEKLAKEDYDEKWAKRSIYNPKPGQNINCHVILKIWNQPADQEKNDENKLILFCDNIYVNPHIMPDHTMAKAFFDAQEKWITKTDYLLGSWEVELGQKLKQEAIRKCLKEIKDEKEDLEKHLRKEDMEGIQKSIRQMAMASRMLDTLTKPDKKEENTCQN